MAHASLASRLAALALGLSAAAPALAAGGTISGKVEATPPKYLEDTVVYLKDVSGTFPKRTEKMDQKGMKFIPHVLTVTKGDTVDFLNHDNVAHNVYSPDNEGYNLGTFKQNETRSHTFDKPGTYAQLCSIHPEMLGYIFVGQNPYAAAVDANDSRWRSEIRLACRQIAGAIDDVPHPFGRARGHQLRVVQHAGDGDRGHARHTRHIAQRHHAGRVTDASCGGGVCLEPCFSAAGCRRRGNGAISRDRCGCGMPQHSSKIGSPCQPLRNPLPIRASAPRPMSE